MSSLPQPRGPVSEALFAGLRKPPHQLAPASGEIEEEDLQLALYCCYELHYRGYEGVDDDWEWEPSLLAERTALERRFEGALRDALATPPPAARDVPALLAGLLAASAGPPLGRFLERQATLEQFREFVVHRSA